MTHKGAMTHLNSYLTCAAVLSFCGSPSWELRTASPRGRYGEHCQRDPCLKHTYIKTPPVCRRQPMTSLPARPQYNHIFSRKEGQPSASRISGPTAAEAQRRMESWGSQLDLVNELERDRPFLRVGQERE